MRIISVVAMTLLLCGVGVCAELKAPSPSAADTTAQQKTQPQNTPSKTDNFKPTTKSLPPIIEISKTPIIQVETTDKTEKHHDYSSSEWWLVYLTFGLVLVTFGLAIYTAKLYHATVGLGKDAKSTSDRQATEMGKSLAIAKESAEAARKTVETMSDTTERQLRAYINISQGIVFNFLDPENRTFRIMFKNFGQTPAHAVSVVTECIIREFPIINNPPLKKFTDADHAVFSVLGPTCTYWQDIPVPITPQEWEDRIINSTAAIYCYGEIRYIDAFNKNRITEFRYMCRENGTKEGNVTPCIDGNNAT